MPLSITSLNSGSNGNCYYVGNEQEAVLVDVGISCREVERRMARLGLPLKKVKAIFISHEHSDHIRGVEVLARKYQLPVYITTSTLKHGGLKIEEHLARPFKTYEDISIGELCITAFPKLHDASDPHSFLISCEGIVVGVFTDIGYPCEHVVKNFKRCHAAFLETNYDETMLQEGNYPYYLKKRIQGKEGHLSNHQALDLFIKHKPSFMSHVLLSHLSKDNNTPQLAHELFVKHAGKVKVEVASRYKETEVFIIGDSVFVDQAIMSQSRTKAVVQMSLF
jgi:phosphoribosyl 1,2-cyclic phosphodiesterase